MRQSPPRQATRPRLHSPERTSDDRTCAGGRPMTESAVDLAERLREPGDVHRDAARLVDRQSLRLHCLGFVRLAVDVSERLPSGVPDDIAAGYPGRRTKEAGSGVRRSLRVSRPHHRRTVRVLDLQPIPRPARPIGRAQPLRHDASEPHAARLMEDPRAVVGDVLAQDDAEASLAHKPSYFPAQK
jgi:hypothetical protein